MAIKKNQKMFYFSDEDTKNFTEARIEDLAIKMQRSSSFVIEKILLDGLLPKNEEAKNIVRYILYSGDEQDSVKRTLDVIFSNNAAGTNWKSKYNNLKPLVEYCVAYGIQISSLKKYKENKDYFLSELKSIVNYIDNCSNACIEIVDREMYLSQLEKAKILLKYAGENHKEIMLRNYFQLVVDCWNMLSDWSVTYRYLACLVCMSDFQENAKARNRLYDIILQISEKW